MIKLATEAQYLKAKDQRKFVEQQVKELLTEKQELKAMRKSKKRTIRKEEIEATVEYLQLTHSKARTASEIFAKVNDTIASRIVNCDETIAKFFERCRLDGVAYTAGWQLDDVIIAEEHKKVYTQMQSYFERTSIAEWNEFFDYTEKEAMKEILQNAERGSSKSTSQVSNLVDDIKAQAAAKLLNDYSGSFGWTKHKIDSLTEDTVVWEDRDF